MIGIKIKKFPFKKIILNLNTDMFITGIFYSVDDLEPEGEELLFLLHQILLGAHFLACRHAVVNLSVRMQEIMRKLKKGLLWSIRQQV